LTSFTNVHVASPYPASILTFAFNRTLNPLSLKFILDPLITWFTNFRVRLFDHIGCKNLNIF